jgi:predicted ArsR family transcriptional regulator
VADESERALRRIAEAEVQSLQSEVERLAGERTRLARKLEHLNALLYDMRMLPQLDELTLRRIEDALAFDGRSGEHDISGWADFDLVPDEPSDS